VLVVRDDTYRQQKDTLRAFIKAWRESAQWMISQPEQAAVVAQKKAIDGQNLELNREIIRLRNLSAVSAWTQRQGLGAMDIQALQKGAQAFQSVGLITRVPDLRAVVTTDLLP
jgi:NitT/TauT family transport system substrate-binding protein